MNVTPNAVAAEMARLHAVLLAEIDDVVAVPAGAPDEEMARRLPRLREHVAEHFRFEEQSGYMTPVLQREPYQERVTEQLRGQHRELLRSLDALMAEVGFGAGTGPGFHDRVRAWVKELRRHEAEENRLYQDAFNVEVTAED
jgi:hypothetical protein